MSRVEKNGKVDDGVPQKVFEWLNLRHGNSLELGCSSLSLRNIPSGGENVVPPAVSPVGKSSSVASHLLLSGGERGWEMNWATFRAFSLEEGTPKKKARVRSIRCPTRLDNTSLLMNRLVTHYDIIAAKSNLLDGGEQMIALPQASV